MANAGGYSNLTKPGFLVPLPSSEMERMVNAALNASLPISQPHQEILMQAKIALEAKSSYGKAKNFDQGSKILQRAMDRAQKLGGRDRAIAMFNWASQQIRLGKARYWLDLIEAKFR